MGRLMHHCLVFLSLVIGVGSFALWLWAQFTPLVNFTWTLHDRRNAKLPFGD